MEYQKIANLLDNEVAPNASNQPSEFRTRNWAEINDESRGTYVACCGKRDQPLLNAITKRS